MEQIVGVAIIRYDGTVFSLPKPNRHHNCIRAMAAAGDPVPIKGKQGFITDTGRFLNRTQAGRLVESNGQYFKRTAGSYPGGELYSEDIW
jgi:hypothetical protein